MFRGLARCSCRYGYTRQRRSGLVEIESVEREPVVEFWREEFGVPPETFDGYEFYSKGAKRVWAVRRDAVDALGGDENLGAIDYESVGLPLMRVGGEHDKPTTDALQRFGGDATRNVAELDAEEAREFVHGETVETEFDEEEDGVDLGYVVAKHDGHVLGCGLYFPGELRSQVPKGRRVDLVL